MLLLLSQLHCQVTSYFGRIKLIKISIFFFFFKFFIIYSKNFSDSIQGRDSVNNVMIDGIYLCNTRYYGSDLGNIKSIMHSSDCSVQQQILAIRTDKVRLLSLMGYQPLVI